VDEMLRKLGWLTAGALVASALASATLSGPTPVEAAPASKCAPAASIREFAVPTASSSPIVIAVGPDANLWFTEFSGNKIARMTEDGQITEFVIPTPNSRSDGIAAGPDDNLWFAESAGTRSAGSPRRARSANSPSPPRTAARP
jgi:streptogramin lyase